MSTRRLIATNTLIQLLGKAATTATSFGTTYLLGRYLGVEFYGDFTKVIATSTLLFMVLDFGLNAIAIKQSKYSPQNLTYTFRSLLGLRLIVATTIYAFILLSLFLLPTPTNHGYTSLIKTNIALFALQYFTQAIILSTNFLFQSQLRYGRAVVATSLGNLAQFGLILAVIGAHPSLNTITLVHLFGIIVTASIGLMLSKSHVSSLLPLFSLSTTKSLLIAASPIGIALTLNIFATKLDTIILSMYRTSTEVGYYGLARRIFDGILVIPSFFMNAVYPVLIEKSIHTRSRLPKIIAETTLFLVIAGIVTGAVVFIASPLILFIRPEFAPSINVLRLLSAFLPVFFVTNLYMWCAITLGKQRSLILVYAAALAANSSLNLVLLPKFGFQVAALTTGITETLVLVLLTWPVLQSLRDLKQK